MSSPSNTRLRSRLAATIAILTLSALAPGAVADTAILVADRDVMLLASSDQLANGSGDNICVGVTGQPAVIRSLVRFDVAGAVPAGSTITAAVLDLYENKAAGGGADFDVHRVLADWGEGASNAGGGECRGTGALLNDATWRYRFFDPSNVGGSPQWSSLGGDFAVSASATSTIESTSGHKLWSGAGLVADVQGWLDGGVNYGWLVKRQSEVEIRSALRFSSRHSSNTARRPMLTITYTPPAVDGACCLAGEVCDVLTETECDGQGGVFQGAGAVCIPNPCLLPTGACCFDDGSCAELSSAACSVAGGAYDGDGTTCEPNLCPQPEGACCFDDTSCEVLTEETCAGTGGSYQGDGLVCLDAVCPLVLEPFVDPLPLPAVAQPTTGTPGGAATYELAIRRVQQQLHRDLPPTTVWGFGDGAEGAAFPGPTIEARGGEPITVTWINDLRDDGGAPLAAHDLAVDTCPHGANDQSPRTVIHLHGGHVPAEVDGYPEHWFLPEQQAVYTYPNNQDAATLWYHDHALGITRLNVYMGMAGFYLVRDDFEDALGLPAGEFEVPIVIQDRTFAADGSLVYPEMWQEHFFGDVILVNGKVWPYLDVKQGKYRFRLLGGSNSRTYRLGFDYPGLVFTQIGSEGGLFEEPVVLETITLGPGERADVVVDFGGIAAGTEIVLTNSAPAPFPGSPGEGVIPEIMQFRVQPEVGHTAGIPAALRPIERLAEDDAVKQREFVLRLGSDPCSESAWLINDLHWDDITEYPLLGTTEIWSFVNRSNIMHPMHMHLVFFQVLDHQPFEVVQGEVVPIGDPLPPGPEEVGWKDTVRVPNRTITRVIVRFEDYPGKFAYHCHILEHEDHEMMRQFWAVEPSPLTVGTAGLAWSAIPGATGYDVVRGDLGALRASGGDFAGATLDCLGNDLATTELNYAASPPAGAGFWFLMRSVDPSGPGTYDTGSPSQTGLRDTEIEASGAACP